MRVRDKEVVLLIQDQKPEEKAKKISTVEDQRMELTQVRLGDLSCRGSL